MDCEMFVLLGDGLVWDACKPGKYWGLSCKRDEKLGLSLMMMGRSGIGRLDSVAAVLCLVPTVNLVSLHVSWCGSNADI